MTDNSFENKIRSLFQSLPRKPVLSADKKRVWFQIENHIAAAREPETGLLHFLFLRNTWSKAAAIIVIVLIAVSLVGGVARATPGETLYGVKKAAEKVEKVLAPTQEVRVKVTIKHAKRRLEEVQLLVAEDRQNGVVSETLDALTNTTQDAVAASENKPEFQNQILELASHEEQVLTTVQDQVEGEVRQAVEKALIATKESLSRLQEPEEAVQGLSSTAPESQATSTIPTAGETSAQKPKTNLKEGVIKSEIQIDQVIDGRSIQ